MQMKLYDHEQQELLVSTNPGMTGEVPGDIEVELTLKDSFFLPRYTISFSYSGNTVHMEVYDCKTESRLINEVKEIRA